MVLGFTSAALVVTLVVLVTWQVFTRYVLDAPVTWAEELARVAMVWLVFIGLPYVALLPGGHIHAATIRDLIPQKNVRSALDLAAELVMIVTAVLLLRPSLAMMQSVSSVQMPGSGIPRAILFAAPLAGFALLVLVVLWNVFAIVTGRRTAEDSENVPGTSLGGT